MACMSMYYENYYVKYLEGVTLINFPGYLFVVNNSSKVVCGPLLWKSIWKVPSKYSLLLHR